jgi:hypothetical protein
MIPTFVGSMRIILCPEVTVVDFEYTLTYKTCFVVHIMCKKELIQSVLMLAVSKIACIKDDLETCLLCE